MRKLFTISLSVASVFYLAQETKTDSIAQAKEIQEVVLKAQRKKQHTDHAAYTFDRDALEKARHSRDLLATLPELQLDPVSNTIKSTKGGKLLLLVNGIEASDNQVKSIAPTNVVRVEYFDIPPARWATRADIVVNIITRNPEVGYSYGVDTQGAFTTGVFNGSAYADYTKGKHNIGVEYGINIRDYDNRISTQKYEYQLSGIDYKTSANVKDHFGYTMQDIAVRYTFVDEKNLTFQAKFNFAPYHHFSRANGENIFTKGNQTDLHHLIENRKGKHIDPKLDLYFSKYLGKKDELVVNLIGSLDDIQKSQYNREWNTATGVDIFNNEMTLNTKQTQLVGEVSHIHTFEKGKLTSGYRISSTSAENDQTNLLGKMKYDVHYLQQYFYTEYSGKWQKLGYRIGMGLTNIYNKTAETTENTWVPTPKIILSYPLAENQTLRLSSSYTSQSASSNALSPNVVQIAPNIVGRGNPLLRSQNIFRNNLTYSFNSKYFDFNILGYHATIKRYFAENYILEGNQYVFTTQNADFQEIGLEIRGSVKPSGNDVLVLKTYLEPISTRLRLENGQKFKYNTFVNTFALASKYKSFTLQYVFNIPVYQMYGGVFLNKGENQNNIALRYQLKNWEFTTAMYWLGMPSRYGTKSLPGTLVNFEKSSQILNNKNMFVLGISYDFSLGKKLQLQKKLQN